MTVFNLTVAEFYSAQWTLGYFSTSGNVADGGGWRSTRELEECIAAVLPRPQSFDSHGHELASMGAVPADMITVRVTRKGMWATVALLNPLPNSVVANSTTVKLKTVIAGKIVQFVVSEV